MTNLIINQDFNNNLMSLLDDGDSSSDEECCLIDGQPLNDNTCIELRCSHKFNYLSILNEVKIQRKYNNLEVQKINYYQIKCPYCRVVHNGILPYYKAIIEEKIRGVNWPPSKVLKFKSCNAILKSGKRKGQPCNKPCLLEFCNIHLSKKHKLSDGPVCKSIIKSGKRKGQPCGCKCKKNSEFCGRHISKKSI